MAEFMTVQEASAMWNISDRRVTVLCKEGRIPGAVKNGKSWKLPTDTVKPSDNRVRSAKQNPARAASLPYKEPEVPSPPMPSAQKDFLPVSVDTIQKDIPPLSVDKVQRDILSLSKDAEEKGILPLPVGIMEFAKISRYYYYHDQTLLIRDLLDLRSKMVVITRPAGFGKSLQKDMLRLFFERSSENNSSYFQRYAIWSCPERYKRHQGQYPVIDVTFKDVMYDSWEKSYEGICQVIRVLYDRHRGMRNSSVCSEQDRHYYQRILDGTASEVEFCDSLRFMSSLMRRVYGMPPILLMDDYDTPLRYGCYHGYAGDAAAFLRNLLVSVCKDNRDLTMAVLFGVLDLTRDPLFHELNQRMDCSIFDDTLAQHFGMTEKDVKAMAAYYGREDSLDQLQEWCSGYRIGSQMKYRTESVVAWLSGGIGANRRIHRSMLMRKTMEELHKVNDPRILAQMDRLIQNESIAVKTENAAMVNLTEWCDSTSVYANFLAAGFLVPGDIRQMPDGSDLCRVSIPNRQGSTIWTEQLLRGFRAFTGADRITDFQEACFEKNGALVAESMKRILMKTVESELSGEVAFYYRLILGIRAMTDGLYTLSYDMNAAKNVMRMILKPEDTALPGMLLEIYRVQERGSEQIRRVAKNSLRQMAQLPEVSAWNQAEIDSIHRISMVYNGEKVCLLSE